MRHASVWRCAVSAFLAVLGSAAGAGCAGAADDVQSFRLLLIERLALMEQVAADKWNNARPIDDPVREANVLKAALARSRTAGLDPAVAWRFIVAQMEAAKLVQRYYFGVWQVEGVDQVPGAPDLVTELRPRIGALSADLIAAMAAGGGQLQTCAAASVLRPVPPALADVPLAWDVAVGGVLGGREDCS